MASDSIHLPSNLIERVSDQFPWDIVVLAGLAVGLGICLYRVLGRRVGAQAVREERPQGFQGVSGRPSSPNAAQKRFQPPPLPGAAGDAQDAAVTVTEREIPAPATRVGGILSRIAEHENGFTPSQFLDQVDIAFRRIVPAFAAGDQPALAGLLTAETEAAFMAAIAARTEAGESQRSDLRAIERLSILDASVTVDDRGAETAAIEVSIVSRQVNILTDRNGEPVQGTDAVTEFHDLWLFERILGIAGASWRLAASRPA